jgi:Ca-activated chloride channel family protein
MSRWLPVAALLLSAAPAAAHGLLIPEDRNVSPLAMLRHRVAVTIDEQVAVTRVEQTFRNHTDRALEAVYVFPVPKGASVTALSMWVDGKEMTAELIEAGKARDIYTSIVRRTQDPALLEYTTNGLMRLRVFPIPPKSDQRISLRFTSVAPRELDIIEYTYPLKTDGKATRTLEEFSLELTLKSEHAIQNIYSPTHAVAVDRSSDREARVVFRQQQALLDKDFHLLYSLGRKDIGLTMLTYRPIKDAEGHFMLMLSPRTDLSKEQTVARDFVFLLDTSGSMAGEKMEQARKALIQCVNGLGAEDRFALMNFSTAVHYYETGLVDASKEQRERAIRWVKELRATGGTAINDALLAALDLRPKEEGRPFTIVFFTDGEPTVGEVNPEAILKNVMARNTANTRIFTFGVGDDVHATLLDQLAERTRAASSYVRPHEDIEVKTSALWNKISQPVLVDLKLTTSKNILLNDMYPTRLPDLFHGGQLLVLGKYKGDGKATITLEGSVGTARRTYTFEVDLPASTGEERSFVENLWARRKIGFLLDQIRANGEKKELKDEVIAIARRHGIATPYTSYLIVPDAAVPVTGTRLPATPVKQPPSDRPNVSFGGQVGQIGQVGQVTFTGQIGQVGIMPGPIGGPVQGGQLGLGSQIGHLGLNGQLGQTGFSGFGGGFGGRLVPGSLPGNGLQPKPGVMAPLGSGGFGGQFGQIGQLGFNGGMGTTGQNVRDFARQVQSKPGELTASRSQIEGERMKEFGTGLSVLAEAQKKKAAYDQARTALAKGQQHDVQAGELGVDLSIQANRMHDAQRLALSPVKRVAGRTCMEIGGVWIDEAFDPKMQTLVVKAQSDAYFLLLERRPELRDLFQLGNYIVLVTPSGTALIIDLGEGKEKLSADEIDALFTPNK